MNTATVSTATQTEHSSPRWRPWPFRILQWRQAIHNSELPSPIQTLLIEVVGGTGLLADEKLEVAEELIAHFQDGLHRGRSVTQVIDDFGDPKIAAKLIRNGKQRNRSMKRRMVQAAFWLSIIGSLACLACLVFFYTGKPQPSTDYLAIINQPILATPEEDNAWPIYRDLWIKYEFGEGGSGTFKEIYTTNEKNGARQLVRPSDGEKWRLAIGKLATCQDLLEGFRVGGLRPSFGVPLSASLLDYSEADIKAIYPRTYKTVLSQARKNQNDEAALKQPPTKGMGSLPYLVTFQKVPQLLVVDTRWAMEQNDVERVTRNLEAIFGMAWQISDRRLVLNGLLGMAIQSVGADLIGECIESEINFSQQQLERIHAAAKQCRIEDMIHFSVGRDAFLDYIQHSYTDNGHGDGRITWDGLALWDQFFDPQRFEGTPENHWSNRLSRTTRYVAAPTKLWQYASRKQLTDRAEGFFDRVDHFLFADKSDDTANPLDTDLANLPDSYRPLKIFLTALLNLKPDVLYRLADREGIVAALGVLRYQKQHGQLPETLDKLVGEFLEKTPRDPIDGQPLRYKVQGDDFLIYSVGTNQIDNGGQHDQGGDQTGDWILWPRQGSELD